MWWSPGTWPQPTFDQWAQTGKQFVPMSCRGHKRRVRGLLLIDKAFATSGSFCMTTVVKITGGFLFASSSSGGGGFSKIYLWLNVTWTFVAKIFAVRSHVGRWNKYEWLFEKALLTSLGIICFSSIFFFTIHLIHSFASKPTFKKQRSPLMNSTSLLPFQSIIPLIIFYFHQHTENGLRSP